MEFRTSGSSALRSDAESRTLTTTQSSVEITMKRLSVMTMGLLVIGLTVSGCSQQMSGQADRVSPF